MSAEGRPPPLGDAEESYTFTTPEALIEDFLADVEAVRGEL
jgi:hypothetical protein